MSSAGCGSGLRRAFRRRSTRVGAQAGHHGGAETGFRAGRGLPKVSMNDTKMLVLTVRLDSPVPLVEQVATGVRCAIARGELREGDPLPTVRQLAADLGINLNTVSRAYRMLEAAGLVVTVRGRGTTVAAVEERSSKSRRDRQKELGARLQAVLADIRLAGLDRDAALRLTTRELNAIWSPPS